MFCYLREVAREDETSAIVRLSLFLSFELVSLILRMIERKQRV